MNVISPSQRPARTVRALFSNAREAIGPLAPGVRRIGLTKGQFSMLDLIRAILGQVGPAELMVCAWTAGRAEMESVANLLDAHNICRFRMLVDRSIMARQPDYVALIQRLFGEETIRQTRTQAKFALIAADEYRIAIRGSMSFSVDPGLGHFDLDDDPDIYSFFDDAVEEMYALIPPGLSADRRAVERGFNAFGHESGYGVRSFICGDLFRRLGQPELPERLNPLDELDTMLQGMHGRPRLSAQESQELDDILHNRMLNDDE